MSASAAAHPQQLTRTRSALRFGRGDDLAQSGTYTVSGNSITFTPDDDDEEFTATRNGDALTFSQEIDLDDDGPAAPQTITIIARK